MIKAILILVSVVVFSGSVQAQVVKPILLEPMLDEQGLKALVEAVGKTPSKNFLSQSLDSPRGNGFRIAFIYKSEKYTVDYNWHTEGIQVWIRQNGKKDPDVFGDQQMTGVVSFGSEEGGSKRFTLEEPIGDEYQSHWQEKYNQMLVGLTKTLKRNKPPRS